MLLGGPVPPGLFLMSGPGGPVHHSTENARLVNDQDTMGRGHRRRSLVMGNVL